MATKTKTIKPSAARKPAAKSTAPAQNGAKASAPKAGKAVKYVYTWGNGKADGDGSHEAAPRRQGREPRGDDPHRSAGASRIHDHHRSLHLLLRQQEDLPAELQAQMEAGVRNMEKIMGYKFGDAKGMPLLVAVRSGARDSMPGMMDTILNLGLNDQTVARARRRDEERALRVGLLPPLHPDVWRRRARRAEARRRRSRAVRSRHRRASSTRSITRTSSTRDLTAEDQKELVKRFKALVKERTGKVFPNDPWEQLRGAAGAVFGSWMNDRAIVYRRKYNIPAEWGTAVNVQAMVYGNTGETSGSGVAFTRNPGEWRQRILR